MTVIPAPRRWRRPFKYHLLYLTILAAWSWANHIASLSCVLHRALGTVTVATQVQHNTALHQPFPIANSTAYSKLLPKIPVPSSLQSIQSGRLPEHCRRASSSPSYSHTLQLLFTLHFSHNLKPSLLVPKHTYMDTRAHIGTRGI